MRLHQAENYILIYFYKIEFENREKIIFIKVEKNVGTNVGTNGFNPYFCTPFEEIRTGKQDWPIV